ncbi:MAG TPA: TPM domain-containing protein [Kocuria rosea]|nr:TPM domain-containing protein [Kocuria rosea]
MRTAVTPRSTARVAGVALVLALTGCAAEESAVVPEPPRAGNVLDAAGVLSADQEQDLNALVEERNDSTDAARVAVLTVQDTHGPIEDYAREVATAWGVGEGGADNGVLIVAATGERELRIETADRVRESFSDGEAEDVVEEVLAPAFADQRYAEGLLEATDQIYRYAQGQQPPHEPVNWALVGSVAGGVGVLGGSMIWWAVADSRRRARIAEEEIRSAQEHDPDLQLSEEQRRAYRKYRCSHRGDDAVTSPAVWLPLYLAHPHLYSGASSNGSSGGGSSFGSGGGFTGGGASGSY